MTFVFRDALRSRSEAASRARDQPPIAAAARGPAHPGCHLPSRARARLPVARTRPGRTARRSARAVVERHGDLSCAQRFGERGKRREADTACDEPRFVRAATGANGLPRGPRHCTRRRASPRTAASSRADPLAEQRKTNDFSVLFENFEHGEGPAQQRLEAISGLHHHELPGKRAGQSRAPPARARCNRKIDGCWR